MTQSRPSGAQLGLGGEAGEAAERREAQVERMRSGPGSSSWACRRMAREDYETGGGGGGAEKGKGLGFQCFCEPF